MKRTVNILFVTEGGFFVGFGFFFVSLIEKQQVLNWIRTKGCTGHICLPGNPHGAGGVTLFGEKFLSRTGTPAKHLQRHYEAPRVTKKASAINVTAQPYLYP